MLEERLVDRIQELIALSEGLRQGKPNYGTLKSEQQRAECSAWLGAAYNAICQACALPGHPYRKTYDDIRSGSPRGQVHVHVGAVGEMLKNMLEDARRGLLTSVADNACAETFDDLLDHADEYFREGRKDGSGILASAVFEDTLRKVARSNEIIEADTNLDAVISSLKREGVITKIVAKRCRTAADVRNAALHADWEAFTLGDVEDVIKLTRQLLEEHLAA